MSEKISAGSAMPAISVPKLGGGELDLGGNGAWRMVIVYRGKHCPICKRYLSGIEALQGEIDDLGLEVVAVSGDSEEQAQAVADETGVKIPLGYGLTKAQMQQLGLYVSTPRPNETDHEFPEPGMFVVNDQGQVQIVDISNAPFARPEIASILRGIRFIQEKGYPIRGTA
ncbi:MULTISPECIES: redoxin domain-containing protein [unclassified Minwuia]|jgi:peroxiredoxin|uniref:redoxin domain-containing protein n=1 Tax=unclassified Minwuia TaxID=2618799 RepID=UPI002479ED9D|nr:MULTISPECIES: redoxin domain-containing protein [unclassified Minwuia]